MKKIFSRILVMFLTMLMVVGMFVFTVFAEDVVDEEVTEVITDIGEIDNLEYVDATDEITSVDTVEEDINSSAEQISEITGCSSGIKGNGTGGLYLDINSYPYTYYAQKSYGQYAYGNEGCAWFASSRACQITGNDTPIYSGVSWSKYYANYGYSWGNRGQCRAKALACYTGHVAVIEQVDGNNVLLSEGGHSYYSDANHGYCVIRWTTISDVESSSFLGYVYLTDSNHDPYGAVDSINGGNGTITVSGWVVDSDDTDAQLSVHVYVGGPASSGANGYVIKADQYRSDNNIGYHGFSAEIQVSEVGNQPVYVYAINTPSGKNPCIGSGTVYITPSGSGKSEVSISPGVYVIHSAWDDNQVLDIQNNSTEVRANIQLYQRIKTNTVQDFRIINNGSYYTIQSVYAGNYLDIHLPINNNSNVQLWSEYTSTEEKWMFEDAGDGYVYIRSLTGFYLDVQGDKAVNNANIQVYRFVGNKSQKWRLEKISEEIFSDVSEDDWFYDSVAYVKAAGIMTGMGDTSNFAPYEPLHREQLAVMLWRLEGEESTAYTNKFSDVPDGTWYTTPIIWAYSKGIISGYNDGRFGVSDNITREQLAVMLYRYAEKCRHLNVSNKADISGFKDASSVSSWAKDAIQWAVGNGIISGKDNGTRIDPQGNAARCECAAMIQRFMVKYGL